MRRLESERDMTCVHCGKWSGLFDEYHEDCAVAVEKGLPIPGATPKPAPGPVSPVSIFWAVFGALCAFALLMVILGVVMKVL